MSLELRPRRLVTVCRGAALLTVVVFTTIAVLLPRGSSGGKQFGPVDQVLFFLTGLALAGAVLLLTRPRVWADEQGIRVRNVLGVRFFSWPVVVGVLLPDGASWAQLELHDDQQVALLAIQANDGELAQTAVQQLRHLHAVATDTQA
jgi:hypothetical protein